MAQGNEINRVLAYIFSTVIGGIVLMLAILLLAIAMIRYRGRKQQPEMKGMVTGNFCNFVCVNEFNLQVINVYFHALTRWEPGCGE